jgi:hypothetical protein
MSEIEIPRLDRPDVEHFHQQFIARARPAVIRGAIDDWPARASWSPAYLRERVGELRIPAMASDLPLEPDTSITLASVLASKVEKIEVRGFLDDLTRGIKVRHYVSGMALESYLPDLLADVVVPPYHTEPARAKARMWLGGPLIGPLHYDRTNNLHAIVHGRKRFRLLPPGQWRDLYPCSVFSVIPTLSLATFFPIDHQRFPRLHRARQIDVELEPGDMIYVPAGWWHQVETPVPTISVDFVWPERPRLDISFLRLILWRVLKRFRGSHGIK